MVDENLFVELKPRRLGEKKDHAGISYCEPILVRDNSKRSVKACSSHIDREPRGGFSQNKEGNGGATVLDIVGDLQEDFFRHFLSDEEGRVRVRRVFMVKVTNSALPKTVAHFRPSTLRRVEVLCCGIDGIQGCKNQGVNLEETSAQDATFTAKANRTAKSRQGVSKENELNVTAGVNTIDQHSSKPSSAITVLVLPRQAIVHSKGCTDKAVYLF